MATADKEVRRKRRRDMIGASKPPDVTRNGSLRSNFFSEIVPFLSDAQVNLIRGKGFGFLLHIHEYRPSLKVASWALLNFDAKTCKLKLDDGREVTISERDWQWILGLKEGGKPLLTTAQARRKKKDIKDLAAIFRHKDRWAGISSTGAVSIEAAKDTLREMKGMESMDATEENLFLKALVIAAVVDFLAPNRGRRYLEPEVVAAIQDPDGPFGFNWAAFAMKALLDATDLYKNNLQKKQCGRTLHVPGCTMFIVVFYLLNFTDCGIPYKAGPEPLISKFNQGTIDALLEWDEINRLQMPSYLVLSAKTKIDIDALRQYEDLKETGKPVTCIPGWDIRGASEGRDGGALEKMFKEYIDLKFMDLHRIMQLRLGEADEDETTEKKAVPWFRQPALELVRKGGISFLRALIPPTLAGEKWNQGFQTTSAQLCDEEGDVSKAASEYSLPGISLADALPEHTGLAVDSTGAPSCKRSSESNSCGLGKADEHEAMSQIDAVLATSPKSQARACDSNGMDGGSTKAGKAEPGTAEEPTLLIKRGSGRHTREKAAAVQRSWGARECGGGLTVELLGRFNTAGTHLKHKTFGNHEPASASASTRVAAAYISLKTPDARMVQPKYKSINQAWNEAAGADQGGVLDTLLRLSKQGTATASASCGDPGGPLSSSGNVNKSRPKRDLSPHLMSADLTVAQRKSIAKGKEILQTPAPDLSYRRNLTAIKTGEGYEKPLLLTGTQGKRSAWIKKGSSRKSFAVTARGHGSGIHAERVPLTPLFNFHVNRKPRTPREAAPEYDTSNTGAEHGSVRTAGTLLPSPVYDTSGTTDKGRARINLNMAATEPESPARKRGRLIFLD